MLPDTFFVNDHVGMYDPETGRLIDRMGPPPTRAGVGLPEDAFVYCNFNQVRNEATQSGCGGGGWVVGWVVGGAALTPAP